MNRVVVLAAAAATALAGGSIFALAQAPGPQPHPMSFFVTSAGMGNGERPGRRRNPETATSIRVASGTLPGAGNRSKTLLGTARHLIIMLAFRPQRRNANVVRSRIGQLVD